MKHIKHLLTTVVALALVACSTHHSTAPVDRSDKAGYVKSTITLGRVGALAKSAAINLNHVTITAVSNAADTVIISPSLTGSEQQSITQVLSLKPLRDWTLTVKSFDSRDSVIHSGTSSVFRVYPADTTDVSLTLGSRYTMCQATVIPPDSISSASTSIKDQLKITRLVLKVDGVTRSDSTVPAGFTGGAPVVMNFDYATSGSNHTVSIEAYGVLHSYTGILYSGSTNFNLAAGVDGSQPLTLTWVGPTTGSGRINVTLGRVGKATVTGTMPGTVIQ